MYLGCHKMPQDAIKCHRMPHDTILTLSNYVSFFPDEQPILRIISIYSCIVLIVHPPVCRPPASSSRVLSPYFVHLCIAPLFCPLVYRPTRNTNSRSRVLYPSIGVLSSYFAHQCIVLLFHPAVYCLTILSCSRQPY